MPRKIKDDGRPIQAPLAKAKRYAKVTTTMAVTGARIAGRHALGQPTDRSERAAMIRAALGALKGPVMKIAQILGTIPDLVPPEYAEAFAALQSHAPEMGEGFVRRRMRAELGDGWETRFSSFDVRAAFAASLGQVHRARGHDGQALACKLQYPAMDSAVEADLRQLSLAFTLFERIDKALDTREVQAELADRLREELDYGREAATMRLFAQMLANEDGVYLPVPVPELSTPRLLTMNWLEGEPFLAASARMGQDEKNLLARRLFRAWYVPFYQYGVLHGDPHFGNYTVRADGGLNLLDFGCVRVFPPSLIEGALKLLESLRDDKPDLAVEAYRAWGFENPDKSLIDVLNIWARFLYAPLLESKVRPIAETNTGVYGRATARKVHEELRRLGRVTVPRAFVLIDRAAVGLGSAFLKLDARLNWQDLFAEVAGDFSVEKVNEKQTHIMQTVLR